MADERREATDEERQKIINALEAGRVKWSPGGQEYWDRAGVIKGGKEADFTVVHAEITHFWGPWEKPSGRVEDPVMGNKGGMEISWSTVSAGFGSLTIIIDRDGKLKADTEGMGKDFCKQVLAKLVDSWEEAGRTDFGTLLRGGMPTFK